MQQPDYQQLIDAETWAFIERTASYYPPDTVDASVAAQREIYDRMCRAFHAGRPAGVETEDMLAEGVGVRVYRGTGAARGTVLYLHGGGFVVGGLESHDDVCAELCAGTGCEVVSVDYRLCPEHPHPAPFEDALAACRWAQGRAAGPLLLCGDSAGANLAAAVAHATRGEAGAPRGQVLIYPALGGEPDRGSYVEHACAPMLTTEEMRYYDRVRRGDADPDACRRDPRFAPLGDTDFAGLPATVVFAAECDPLCDDGEQYCQRLREAGVAARAVVEPGLVHGYLRARHSVERARASFARITAALGDMC